MSKKGVSLNLKPRSTTVIYIVCLKRGVCLNLKQRSTTVIYLVCLKRGVSLNLKPITFLQLTCIISDEQIGFRSGYRTSDHIFKSKTILDKYLSKSKMVYAYFIDLRNALDSVLPPTLSFKVVDAGVGEHFLSVLKSMYGNIELRVRLDNISLSDVFSSSVGVFQGGNLSLNLFKIFINDMTKLFDSSCCPVSLGSRLLNSLLYADDLLL